MQIDIIFPRLPPAIDGIGDHSLLLAAGIAARGHEVRLLTRHPEQSTVNEMAGLNVQVVEAWPNGNLLSVDVLKRAVAARRPDWLILQFEQFSYGRYGYNPKLARLFTSLKHVSPNTKVLLYAHENYTKPITLKKAILSSFQMRQYRRLTATATRVVISTDAWRNSRDYSGVAPILVPVFSNIPMQTAISRSEILDRYDICSNRPIVVNFGNFDPSRSDYLISAALALSEYPFTYLYVGKDGSAVQSLLAGLPNVFVKVVSSPSSAVISELLSVSDISISPFGDGVTGRRGSFLAALQHGVPTVTTISDKEPSLLAAREEGVFAASALRDVDAFGRLARDLMTDLEMRRRMSHLASQYYKKNFHSDLAISSILTLMIGADT